MRRQTFDMLLTLFGGILTAAMLIAGVLLMWGYSFANGTVHDQLAAQRIFFPAAGSPALSNPEIGTYMRQYAGQQLVNGRQAEVWANHYIAVHLQSIGDGQSYSELSAKLMADPTNKDLAQQVQAVFQGETLRSMLLSAYAFWTFGQISLYAGIAAFVLAALLGLLTILGWRHFLGADPNDVV